MKSAEGSVQEVSGVATRPPRRSYTDEQRLQVIAECRKRGASIAGVALRHGINANLVRKWIVRHQAGTLRAQPTMLPVVVDASSSTPDRGKTDAVLNRRVQDGCDVRIEFGDLRIVASGAMALEVVSVAIRATLGQ